MTRSRNGWLCAALLFCLPLPAWAAPFCLQAQGIPPQCDYFDAAQCRKRAYELKGVCIANSAEWTIKAGSGKYCVADSSRTILCDYADRSTCEADAVRNNGVCIEVIGEQIQQDPYQYDPNRKY